MSANKNKICDKCNYSILICDCIEEGKKSCNYCGCTNEEPCEGGCEWIAKKVCSNCGQLDIMYWQGYDDAVDEVIKIIKDIDPTQGLVRNLQRNTGRI